MIKKFISIGFILLLFGLLTIPLFSMLVGISPQPIAIFENRPLEPAINFEETAYINLPKKIEAFLSDHMGFRSQMIAGYMRIWEEGLGSHVRYFLKGDNGEYYPDFKEAPVVRRYLGLSPLSETMVDDFLVVSAGTQAFWEMKGIDYITAMIPDKTSMYKEFLPSMLRKLKTKNIAQQIDERFKNTTLNYLDLSTALLPYMAEHPLYNKKFDTVHWNGYALEAAYKILCDELSKTTIQCQVPPRGGHYTIVQKYKELGHFGSETVPWMRILHPEDLQVIPNKFVPGVDASSWMKTVLVKNLKAANGKLLFLTDSYFKLTHQDSLLGATAKVFPLAHHVQDYLHMHYKYARLAVMEKIVEEFKPDAVVSIFSERTAIHPVNLTNPYLLLLGEAYLKSSGICLTPDKALRKQIKSSNCELASYPDHILLNAPHSDPMLYLQPTQPDPHGRVVLLAKLFSPVETVAQLFYAQGSQHYSEERSVQQKIHKGDNYIRFSVYGNPSEGMNLRFDPGKLSGKFKLLPIPEINNL